MGRRNLDGPQSIFDLEVLRRFLGERGFKVEHAHRVLGHLARIVGKRASGEAWDGATALSWSDLPEGLPSELYSLLPENFLLVSSKVVRVDQSADTCKMVVELQDGLRVEAVIMRYNPKAGRNAANEDEERKGDGRATLCVSSQVGCQMACTFCATGTMGLKGDLTSAEIFEQLIHASHRSRIRNVVFMGMGEPLNNYRNMVDCVRLMTDDRLYGLSPSRITVSTVGVTNRIRSLAADLPGVNLALSLHAPNQDLRLTLVPSGRAYPIDKLVKACKSWQDATGRKVFVEYVVLGGINDHEEHAHELGRLLVGSEVLALVNLIPWNPTEAGTGIHGYSAPRDDSLYRFQGILREHFNMRCTVRREFGQDVQV